MAPRTSLLIAKSRLFAPRLDGRFSRAGERAYGWGGGRGNADGLWELADWPWGSAVLGMGSWWITRTRVHSDWQLALGAIRELHSEVSSGLAGLGLGE
ncbi:hypothetical protein D9M68_600820 [compost metagenome]